MDITTAQSVPYTLNDAQHRAAIHPAGSILVIAGAGSGKTRVITARIIHLLTEKMIQPSAIIALTFTNKAALEMRERIIHLIGPGKEIPFIGTFHGYAVRLLKQYSSIMDIPPFSILDEDDQQKIISGILQRNNMQKFITPRNAIYTISQTKNMRIDASKPMAQFQHPFMQEIFNAYEQEKKASHCFDFDDLLLEVLNQFKTKPLFKQIHQNGVRHILVDEYQDTNVVQNELLKQMALDGKKLVIDSLCAVGDEDQSIYSWRGATVTNIRNFSRDFGTAELIKIEQNYRSVQPILAVANHIIANNTERNPKELWSEKTGTDRVRLLTCVSEYQEADAIAQFLHAAGKKQKRHSIAILYRTHIQSRAIEESLIKQSIPYKIIGGTQFYDRKEIKDLLAYLRLIVNPFDRPSFFRIINTPARSLGEKFEQLFYDTWHDEPFLTFTQVAHKIIGGNQLKKAQTLSLYQFTTLFDGLEATQLPSTALKIIIERTHYLTYLKETYEPLEAETRTENVQELLDAVNHLETEQGTSIEQFLAEVALMQDKMQATDDHHDKVLMMTLHAAKGLEFDTVIVSGLEEGIMPSARSQELSEAVEEERRLFYVGITRARERLLITHAKYRYTYGRMVDQSPSRFLLEIPASLITKEDCTYFHSAQLATCFTNWLNGQVLQETKISPTVRLSTKHKQAPHAEQKKSILDQQWRINQPVSHATHGLGMVQSSEQKGEEVYVTVKFKSGTKKIVSRFLQRV